MIDWLIDRLNDWMIDWLTDKLNEWLNDWLIELLIDWMIDWMIDRLIDGMTDWMIQWYSTHNNVKIFLDAECVIRLLWSHVDWPNLAFYKYILMITRSRHLLDVLMNASLTDRHTSSVCVCVCARSVLHVACEQRHVHVVQCLVDKHVDVLAVDDQGMSSTSSSSSSLSSSLWY